MRVCLAPQSKRLSKTELFPVSTTVKAALHLLDDL